MTSSDERAAKRVKELLEGGTSTELLLAILIVRIEELNQGIGFFLDQHRHRSYEQDEKIKEICDAVANISRTFSNGVPVKNYESSSYTEGVLKVQVTNSR